MAAYHGLHRLVPQDKPVDDLGVRVLAGICENLYGRQLYEAGAKLGPNLNPPRESEPERERPKSCTLNPPDPNPPPSTLNPQP